MAAPGAARRPNPAAHAIIARRDRRRHNLRVDLPVNTVDLVIAGMAILAAVIGWRSGALPQVLGLAGAAAGVALVILAVPAAATALDGFSLPVRAFLAFGGAFLVVTVAEAIGSTLGGALRDRLGRGVASRLDSALGALFGIAQALVLAWLVGGLLATGPIPQLAVEAQRSIAVRSLLGAFPAPSEVAGELGGLLDTSGLPQVFSGLDPIPAPAVPVPGQGEAAQIAAAAGTSVVRVVAQGCGEIFTGTGFAVAPNFVVTNAHVVAGATSVEITADATGRRAPGSVVFFDPELDVALVRTPGLQFRALSFAAESPGRGTLGAALGHPNGGALTVIPAAVAAEIRASGRDIYATRDVVRDILELRAPIEPGDSGGPFLLADGSVGGVVFAQSRTDAGVGYALDPVAVADEVIPLLGRTAATSTGPCLR
jgi:S1-C subfamily serine protease